LSPILRQTVKTQFSLNGDLSLLRREEEFMKHMRPINRKAQRIDEYVESTRLRTS